MKILEQILKEIDSAIKTQRKICYWIANTPTWRIYESAMRECSNIIRSHMENDGWIPVEERLPEKTIETFGDVFSSEPVLVTIIKENGEIHCALDFLIGEQ